MEVFAEDPSATIDAVAAAAGVGRATVHRHFPTRDDLRRAAWLGALDDVGRAVSIAVDQNLAAVPALDRVLEAILAESVAYRVLVRVAVEVDAQVDAAYQELLGSVGAVLGRARSEGLLDDAMDIGWLADAWSGVALVALEWVAAGKLDQPAAVVAVRRTYWAGAGSASARRMVRR